MLINTVILLLWRRTEDKATKTLFDEVRKSINIFLYFAEVNENSKKFLVYRSSAGSGKTFTLVKEYLAILLQKDSVFSFKYILAITFTNKAANEMKERVLHTLHSFAGNELLQGGEKTMMDILKKELIKGEEYIREKSREIVTAVLHNYGDFNITTIDKFMLKVVRAFAHDLKLPINFEIELDDKTLVSNAVDQLLHLNKGLIAQILQDCVDQLS